MASVEVDLEGASSSVTGGAADEEEDKYAKRGDGLRRTLQAVLPGVLSSSGMGLPVTTKYAALPPPPPPCVHTASPAPPACLL